MTELIFITLSAIAALLAIRPLRTMPRRVVVIVAIVMLFAVGMSYWTLGGWQASHAYSVARLQREKAEAMLSLTRDPSSIIQRLKAQVEAHPKRAKGWYLLGRLYASQHQWQNATHAFKKAHHLHPKDLQVTVNLAQSLLLSDHAEDKAKGRVLLQDILAENPMQGDALAMVAMDAYLHEDYPHAIEAWQRLLTLLPPDSEDAAAIRKAIAKAYRKQ